MNQDFFNEPEPTADQIEADARRDANAEQKISDGHEIGDWTAEAWGRGAFADMDLDQFQAACRNQFPTFNPDEVDGIAAEIWSVWESDFDKN